MFERLARKDSALYWWLKGLVPSVVIGIAISLLMMVGRDHFRIVPGVLGGALIGVICMTSVWILQTLLHERLQQMPPMPARILRGVMYTVGGSIGFVIGLTLSLRIFWHLPFAVIFREVNFLPMMLIAAVIALVIGATLFTYHQLRQRLEESIVRLKEHEFAEKELELARSIQSRLLPPPESQGEGYRVAARNLAARYVAGDFYDVFPLSDGSLGLVVADVSGKGIGASLIMASVKATLPLLAGGKSVAQTLGDLNARLSKELGKREFVALAFARFDPRSGQVEIANAGLPDAYLLREGRGPETLSPPGPRLPLGVRGAVRYEAVRAELGHGDRLLLFSDGLPEAPTGPGEPLGYEALAALFSSDGQRSPGEWLDDLFAAVRSRTSATLDDDWTALMLERT